MKITFSDATELKSHALARLKEFTDAGVDRKGAVKLVNDYLTKSEFCSTEGHVLKLTLDDGQPEGAGPGLQQMSMSAAEVSAAVTVGVKAAFAGTTSRAPINPQPSVDVVKEPWEKLLETRAEGKRFSNWGFANVGEYVQCLHRMHTQPQAGLDERLGLIKTAHAKIRDGLSQDSLTYQKALKWGGVLTKATPTTYASELVGADGGFMVPPEYREEVWEAVRDEESILSMCDLSPTESNVVNLVADQNLPWDNTSGIISGWRVQGTTMTQSKPVLQNRQVQLNEVYALVPATDELMQDTPQLNTYLMKKAPQKIGWQIDDAIFRGNGNGQPLGFMSSPAAITITATAGNKTLNVPDLSTMISQLLQPSMKEPTGMWIMTPSAYAYSINLALGSSVGYPIFMLGRSLEGKILPSLLGMPIYQSQHAAAWSSAGDVMLVDLKRGYAAFNKTNGIDFATSIHLFFDAGATAFRWRFRIGGEPYLKTSVAPAQSGNASYSHFILNGSR